MSEIHRRLGVELGPYRRYAFEDFHGPKALDLRERGVLVAPPNCARAGFFTRFDNPCRIVMTGWALLKNAIYRYGVEHALPLSDHADFDELMELIERVRPKKIYSHHGYREFAEILKAKGFDAELARPDATLAVRLRGSAAHIGGFVLHNAGSYPRTAVPRWVCSANSLPHTRMAHSGTFWLRGAHTPPRTKTR